MTDLLNSPLGYVILIGSGGICEPLWNHMRSIMERVTLTIDGMSCGHCVRAVEQALRAVQGVEVEKVDIGTAVLAYDAAAVRPDQIEGAIAEEGYTVRSIEAT